MAHQEPKDTELANFLRGAVDDQTQKRCEDRLLQSAENRDTLAALADTVNDDSLLAALKLGDANNPETGGFALTDGPQLQGLVEKIEALVPRHSISADELSRIFDPSDNPQSLGRIGRFEVTEFLASGGMGLVFRAVDPELNREVCIKLLSPSHEFNAEAKSRFDRESREMAKMNCERIVTVLEVASQKELPYFVMPLLPGSSLRTVLDREGNLSTEQTLEIVRQLSEGLNYAHQQGVLHRDIKPDNLWVLPGGNIKILDFGLAHIEGEAAPITRSGTVLGTPSYMSPEQVKGMPLDPRSDLFSVGVVLVEMLTGKSPFQKANLFSTLMSVASEKIEISGIDSDGEIPAPLQTVVMKLLEKDPVDRMPSAKQLLQHLDSTTSDSSPAPKTIVKAARTKHGYLKWIAACAAGFAACLAGLLIWQTTNKGTLVVSTDDPKVEVRIADEQVNIVDPVSGKRYLIRIGDTPLPSGVYQLESTDVENGLSFSSQTIAIKRGEKSIVTVKLVPAESDHDVATSNNNPSPIDALDTDSLWADSTRDPSAYTEAGQTKIADKLRNLPGLDLRELGFVESNAISEHATVQSPAPSTDAKTWTVESTELDKGKSHDNADKSMRAYLVDGWLNVRNTSLKKSIAILPVPGSSYAIKWDASNPNLVAVSSVLETEDEKRYVIFVWHIEKGTAKLIRAIKADKGSFIFDRGYRIFCFNRGRVEVRSIIDDKSWLVPDSTNESFNGDSISPNGRYVTTFAVLGDQTQYSILDLKTGRLVRAIHGPGRIQWNSDSTRIAAYYRDPNSRNAPGVAHILDLATGSSLEEITIEEHALDRTRTALSPDFTVLATTIYGDVLLMDVASGRKSELPLPLRHSNYSNGFSRIQWQGNNSLSIKYTEKIMTGMASKSIRHNTTDHYFEFKRNSGISGEIVPVETNGKSESNIARIELRKARFLKDGNLGLAVEIAGNSRETPNNFCALKVSDKKTDFLQRYSCNSTSERLMSDLASKECFSPSGKYAVTISEFNSRRELTSSGGNDIFLFNIAEPEKSAYIGTFEWIREICWNDDETFVSITGREHSSKGTSDVGKIVDLKNMKIVDVEGYSGFENSPYHVVSFGNGFICTVAFNSRFTKNKKSRGGTTSWQYRIVMFDPESKSDQTKSIHLGNYLGFAILSATVGKAIDGRRILTVYQKNVDAPESKPKVHYYNVSEKLKLEKIQGADSIEFTSIHIYELPLDDSESKFTRDLGLENVIRHNDDPAKLCLQGNEGTIFFDSKSRMFGPVIRHVQPNLIPLPCKEGWTLFATTSISVYDFEGKLVRRRFVYFDEEKEEPVVTGWIQNNGNGATELLQQHNRGNKFRRINFLSGAYNID